MTSQPRTITTFLSDGTPEGVRIIDIEKTIVAVVVPRLALGQMQGRPEIKRPGLYFLISSDGDRAYIGETEGSYDRLKSHVKNKDWWNVAILIVHITDDGLDKSDIKQLEHLAISQAQNGSIKVENRVTPKSNTVRETRIHSLQNYLRDIQFILTFLNYDILAPQNKTQSETIWHCQSKLTDAKAVFRADQFVVLAGSRIDKSHTTSFAQGWPQQVTERQKLFDAKGIDRGDYVELTENVAFKSPNHAGHIVTGRSINAWTTWKNESGRTMHEAIRKNE